MTPSERCQQLESRLVALEQRIVGDSPSSLCHPYQTEMPEWLGADVWIISDFTFEPKDFMEAHNLRVCTHHAKALTWLFLEVRDAFGDLLDASNKYGFYGSMADAALRHLAAHQPEPEDPRPLLRTVLVKAFEWLRVVRELGGIPADSLFVGHAWDDEGVQRRIDLETGEDTF
jgi:hypothetical protein